MIEPAQALRLAQAALAQWGGVVPSLQLVWQSENRVYSAQLRDGTPVAVRLHRPGYQDVAGIATELDWCAQLAAAGVAVAEPLRAADGGWLTELDGCAFSCLRWIEGVPLGLADAPLQESAVLARAEDLGVLIADLHNATDAGACPSPFARASWDGEALLGDAPRWGRFWENSTLLQQESALLLSARDLARAQIGAARDFGPIHADVLRGNVMITEAGLRLIDFDDCGPGWRLYDLASALIQSWGDPLLPTQAQALVSGYRSRRNLPADQLALLPLFLALRGFASAGWVVSRAAENRERQRAYALRALELAQMLLDGTSPWEGLA